MSVTMLQSCRAYNVPRGSRLFIRKKKKKNCLVSVFKLNLADCQKCLDNITINGVSCSPKLANFTGKIPVLSLFRASRT